MRSSNHVGIALLSALSAGTGCEVVAGIEDRYPPPPASSSTAASGSGGTGSTSGTAGGGTGSGSSGTAGGGGGGEGGGSSACGPTSSIIPVPDSKTQFCSHTQSTGLCPGNGMPYYGQDGNFNINAPTYELSQGTSEQTLTDCMTGLVWRVKPNPPSDLTWNSAVALCNDLVYAGSNDWRLPSRRELLSLLDLGRPAVSSGIAPVFPAELQSLVPSLPANPVYWTGTDYALTPKDSAWAVRLIGSLIEPLPKNSTPEGRALCVRGPAPYGNPTFSLTTDTVKDTTTNLVWERNISTTERWDGALNYCNLLDLGGQQDWRLPTMKELAYLADDLRTFPAIDPGAFPNALPEEYWSSSASPADPTTSWTVHFSDGRAQTNGTNTFLHVRCVRTDPIP